MSLFFSEANVTGTDSTVMVGRVADARRSCAVSAVVEVTSVQPTSTSALAAARRITARAAAAP